MSIKSKLAGLGPIMAGALMLCTASQAGAALLYENPAQLVNDFGNCRFTSACLSPNSFGATEFTLAGASTVGSVSFTAIELGGTPNDPTGIDWKIFNDDDGTGNIPGTLITSGNNFSYTLGPAQVGSNFTHYEYTVDIPDLALGGGTYWLAYRVLSPSFDTYWSLAQNTIPSAASDSLGVGGWGPGYQGMAGVAIAVYDANDIPEPGTLALFGLGLVGLGIARRKRAA